MPDLRWIYTIGLAVLTSATAVTQAADLRTFADANLHAVKFLDVHEGWAAGDQGTVWHTMDGGLMWERQPTGTRATLTDIHVRDYRFVWISGRESLPFNPGSAGIVISTDDGGIRWDVASRQYLSGLRQIHFFDGQVGWAVGETTAQHPSGVYFTTDGASSWSSVRGNRQFGWTSAWFPTQPPNAPAKQALQYGVLGGYGGSLATIREGVIMKSNADWLPGATVRDIDGTQQRLWAVGDQAQIFYSDDQGVSWQRPNVQIPASIRRSWDLNAVSVVGDHVWVVGRPGSVVLHSADGGATWTTQQTGQSLPLEDVHFASATHGWAVGALGTILHTQDGGATWALQRPLTVEQTMDAQQADKPQERLVPQSRHAAVLWLTDSGNRVPLSVVGRYGGEEGYYTAAFAAVGPDLSENLPGLANRPARFSEAFRAAGGGIAETSWKFPLGTSHVHDPLEHTMSTWNRLYEGKAAEEMERDLVLAIRIWRPEVIVTDDVQASADNPVTAAMVALGAKHAFQSAADPNAYPEQLQLLGLKPHAAKKLYGRADESPDSTVVHGSGDFGEQLGESFADAADVARAALLESYEPTESKAAFVLLETRVENGKTHRSFLEGMQIAPGSEMRRQWTKAAPELAEELRKNAERKRNLLAIAQQTDNPERLLAHLKSQTQDLTMLQAGHAIFQIGQGYVEKGQWHLAHPVFEYVAAYYPEHPLALEAYRWLIAYQVSGEARARADKLLVRDEASTRFQRGEETPTEVDQAKSRQVIHPANDAEKWNEVALIYGDQLRHVSGQLYVDPRIQLCLASAHRTLGNIELLNYHYGVITDADPASRWNDVISLEKWYFNRTEQPPRTIAWSVEIPEKPYLDGQLTDECWQGGKQLQLTSGDEIQDGKFKTRAIFRHDQQFLYIGAECAYPDASYAMEPVKRNGYDADVSAVDRVELLLDLDRDYSTYYRLQVDQRGLTAEDCWGDKTWNPRWFVAVTNSEKGWSVEAAIPLNELTESNSLLTSKTWAFNVVRVVPGEAVLSWTRPASAEPRPEGFSFLKFVTNDQSRSLQPLTE